MYLSISRRCKSSCRRT